MAKSDYVSLLHAKCYNITHLSTANVSFPRTDESTKITMCKISRQFEYDHLEMTGFKKRIDTVLFLYYFNYLKVFVIFSSA